MKVVVLGAGGVGRAIALDLAADSEFQVTAADADAEALSELRGRGPIDTITQDLSDPEGVRALVGRFEFAVDALPGHLGFRTLQAILEAGVGAVDIAFFPEDPFRLGELAEEKGVTAIVDCGVAPGMSNLLVGHVDRRLDRTESVAIYVGGLPAVRRRPYEYRAVFSPVDVIEEYTRPARFVEHGEVVVRPALSDLEHLELPGIGTLEAFNTDGLRTLIDRIDAPTMQEKTLRYPGHAERIALLRDTGLLGIEPVDVGATSVRPIDLTSRLLFAQWKLEPGEADLTAMRVTVDGTRDGNRVRTTFDLLDRYDPETDTTSMARTTGYAATMGVRLLAGGHYRDPGIHPPEDVGRDPDCVAFVLAGLAARGIIFREAVAPLG